MSRNRIFYTLSQMQATSILQKLAATKGLSYDQQFSLGSLISQLSGIFKLVQKPQFSLFGSLKSRDGQYSGIYASKLSKDLIKYVNQTALTTASRYLYSKVRYLAKTLRMGRPKKVLKAARECVYANNDQYKNAKGAYSISKMTPKQISKRRKHLITAYGTDSNVDTIQSKLQERLNAALDARREKVGAQAKKIAESIVRKTNAIQNQPDKQASKIQLATVRDVAKRGFSQFASLGSQATRFFKGVSRSGMTLEQVFNLQGAEEEGDMALENNLPPAQNAAPPPQNPTQQIGRTAQIPMQQQMQGQNISQELTNRYIDMVLQLDGTNAQEKVYEANAEGLLSDLSPTQISDLTLMVQQRLNQQQQN